MLFRSIQDLVLKDKLSIEQALKLTAEQADILDKFCIRDLVLKDKLSIEQALEFTVEQTEVLKI